MSPFGVDFRQTVAAAIREAGGLDPMRLVKTTPGARNPNNPTAPTPSVEVRHDFQGVVLQEENRRPGSAVSEVRWVLLVILGTLPSGVEPAIGDKVEDGGTEREIIEVISRDPAGASLRAVVT